MTVFGSDKTWFEGVVFVGVERGGVGNFYEDVFHDFCVVDVYT